MNQALTEQIAHTDPIGTTLAQAIQRYIDGDSLQVLAAEMGISRIALRAQIMRHCLTYTGIEYHHLITNLLAARVTDADTRLEEATDMLNIARAREQCRYARMDLERRRPQLYGPKQELAIDNKVTVIVQRQPVAPPPPMIEATAQPQDDTIIRGAIPGMALPPRQPEDAGGGFSGRWG